MTAEKDGIHVVMDLAIVDTNAHVSDVTDYREFSAFLALLQNDLNQQVSVLLEGAYEPTFTAKWTISTTVVVAGGRGSANIFVAGGSPAWPYVRATVTAAVAPGSGTMKVIFCKRRAKGL